MTKYYHYRRRSTIRANRVLVVLVVLVTLASALTIVAVEWWRNQ